MTTSTDIDMAAADKATRLRAQLDARRQQTGERATELREEVKSTFDWREQVRRHPLICAGAAAAIGYACVPARRQVVKLEDGQVERLVSNGRIKLNVDSTGKESRGAIAGLLLTAAGFAVRTAVTQLLMQKNPWSDQHESME